MKRCRGNLSYKMKYKCNFFFIFGPVFITGEGGGALLQGNLVIKVKSLALCCRTIADSDTSLSSVSFLLFLVFLKAKPSNYEKHHLPDRIVFPVISAATPPPLSLRATVPSGVQWERRLGGAGVGLEYNLRRHRPPPHLVSMPLSGNWSNPCRI